MPRSKIFWLVVLGTTTVIAAMLLMSGGQPAASKPPVIERTGEVSYRFNTSFNAFDVCVGNNPPYRANVDSRLVEHWGSDKLKFFLLSASRTIHLVQGSAKFRERVDIAWDKDRQISAGQWTQGQCISNSREKSDIILHGDVNELVLAHELSHAATTGILLHQVLSEGISHVVTVVQEQIPPGSGPTQILDLKKIYRDIYDGRAKGSHVRTLATGADEAYGELADQEGRLSKDKYLCVFQLTSIVRTLIRLNLARQQKVPGSNIIAEFLDWKRSRPEATFADCVDYFRRQSLMSPGEFDRLASFRPMTPGLKVFPVLADPGPGQPPGPPRSRKGLFIYWVGQPKYGFEPIRMTWGESSSETVISNEGTVITLNNLEDAPSSVTFNSVRDPKQVVSIADIHKLFRQKALTPND